MTIYDITVPISTRTPTYPGDPPIVIEPAAAISAGDPANVTRLDFGTHTATHVDAPAHFIEGARKADSLPLDVLIGEARVVEFPPDVRAITADHVAALDLGQVERVLFRTCNSAFWGDLESGFRTDFTYIEPDAARALVGGGVRLVGIDYLSVERFKSDRFETHKILLSHNVVIVEGLDLRGIKGGLYELICLPLKISGGTGDGAPARAILRTFG
jgi:arylformamidase